MLVEGLLESVLVLDGALGKREVGVGQEAGGAVELADEVALAQPPARGDDQRSVHDVSEPEIAGVLDQKRSPLGGRAAHRTRRDAVGAEEAVNRGAAELPVAHLPCPYQHADQAADRAPGILALGPHQQLGHLGADRARATRITSRRGLERPEPALAPGVEPGLESPCRELHPTPAGVLVDACRRLAEVGSTISVLEPGADQRSEHREPPERDCLSSVVVHAPAVGQVPMPFLGGNAPGGDRRPARPRICRRLHETQPRHQAMSNRRCGRQLTAEGVDELAASASDPDHGADALEGSFTTCGQRLPEGSCRRSQTRSPTGSATLGDRRPEKPRARAHRLLHHTPAPPQPPRHQQRQDLPARLAPCAAVAPHHDLRAPLPIPPQLACAMVVRMQHAVPASRAACRSVAVGIAQLLEMRLQIPHLLGNQRSALLAGSIRSFKACWRGRREFFWTHGTSEVFDKLRSVPPPLFLQPCPAPLSTRLSPPCSPHQIPGHWSQDSRFLCGAVQSALTT